MDMIRLLHLLKIWKVMLRNSSKYADGETVADENPYSAAVHGSGTGCRSLCVLQLKTRK